MAIVQIPSNVVVSKQPKVYVYTNNSSVSGTYYTLLSLTNSRGIISKITMANYNYSNQYSNIRVTIDGTVNTFGNPTGGANGSLGLNHGLNTNDIFNAQNTFDYFCNITFLSSVTVELMQNTGTNIIIQGNVMYSTE